MLFITVLGWLGWRHLNAYLPWPLVSVDHGGDRLRGLHRPDGAAGPHAAGQAPDRPDPGAVAPHRRGDGGRTRSPWVDVVGGSDRDQEPAAASSEGSATASAMAAAIVR